MPKAGIPSVMPIYITEYGWPMGPMRSYSWLSGALEIVISTISNYIDDSNMSHHIIFGLIIITAPTQVSYSSLGYFAMIIRQDWLLKSTACLSMI